MPVRVRTPRRMGCGSGDDDDGIEGAGGEALEAMKGLESLSGDLK